MVAQEAPTPRDNLPQPSWQLAALLFLELPLATWSTRTQTSQGHSLLLGKAVNFHVT